MSQPDLIDRVANYLGKRGLRWFRWMLYFYGEVDPVLRLNQQRKGIPAHPIHFREGMQIRNFLRRQPECAGWSDHEYDDRWMEIVAAAVRRVGQKKPQPTRLTDKFKALVNRLFRLEEINGAGRCPTYLYRWTLLSTPWWNIYLHHFVADDWALDMHDHPKKFITLGLKGGYIEQVPAPAGMYGAHRVTTRPGERLQLSWYRYWGAPWIRSFPASHVHRIIIPTGQDCWTLCIAFKAVRQWGFWADGQWMPWREYVGSKRADKMKSCP